MARSNSPLSLDKWRDFFGGAKCDIFEIIESAIMVAARDRPFDFKLKRDQIAEVLFACKVTKCYGCDRIELALPSNGGLEQQQHRDRHRGLVAVSKGKDVADTKEGRGSYNGVNQIIGFVDDAEALNDEIEEEARFFDEVLRIKGFLDNSEDESEGAIFNSLRKLQLMDLSIETLKSTEIGKTVNLMRKHRSKEIRDLAKTLVGDWKKMVDTWVDATQAVAGPDVETESVKLSAIEDMEGLPSPPLDEGAFFANPTSMELSQFFDGMDDDGNPQECGRKPAQRSRVTPKDKKATPNRPTNAVASGPGRPKAQSGGQGAGKPNAYAQRLNEVKKVAQRKSDNGSTTNKKPIAPKNNNSDCNDKASIQKKLEASKRKLHEGYQKLENAKKARTVQMVDLCDLPKQSLVQRNQNSRPGNINSRQLGKGRH